jgi:hypothetical protein
MARAPYESVLGPAGWGIRDTATGEVVVDGYDDAEDAWHAFMAEDDGIPIRDITTKGDTTA